MDKGSIYVDGAVPTLPDSSVEGYGLRRRARLRARERGLAVRSEARPLFRGRQREVD